MIKRAKLNRKHLVAILITLSTCNILADDGNAVCNDAPGTCAPPVAAKPNCFTGNGSWWECNLPWTYQDPTLGVQGVPPCSVLFCEPATALVGETVMDVTAYLSTLNRMATTPILCEPVGSSIHLVETEHAFTALQCATVETSICSQYGDACAENGSTEAVNVPEAKCCKVHQATQSDLTCGNAYLSMSMGSETVEINSCCIAAGEECDLTLPGGGCCDNPPEGSYYPASCGKEGSCCFPEGGQCISDSQCCLGTCALDEGYEDGNCDALGDRRILDGGRP